MNIHRQKHHNTILFILFFVGFIIFSQSSLFISFSKILDSFPFFGAILAGLLFASTFTAIAGGLILIHLAIIINPLALVLLAALGAVTFDTLIFIFFRKHVSAHISDIYYDLRHHDHFKKITHTKYFAWTLPVIGALIMASPLPDELGISLLGLSSTNISRFLLISTLSHFVGISSVIAGSILL
ncbi:MAG: hypothetical protein WAV41_02990 [Microgenomates group bacterium]